MFYEKIIIIALMKRILKYLFLGIIISALLTIAHYYRGRYAVYENAQRMYPGSEYCVGAGYIDVESSSEFMRVQYQALIKSGDIYVLVPDYMEMFICFLILSVWYFLVIALIAFIAGRLKGNAFFQ